MNVTNLMRILLSRVKDRSMGYAILLVFLLLHIRRSLVQHQYNITGYVVIFIAMSALLLIKSPSEW
jgi:hypothetical protein